MPSSPEVNRSQQNAKHRVNRDRLMQYYWVVAGQKGCQPVRKMWEVSRCMTMALKGALFNVKGEADHSPVTTYKGFKTSTAER
jgi:hypothetical protein